MNPLVPQLARQLSFADLDKDALRSLIAMARREDLEGHGLRQRPAHTGDLTSQFLPANRAQEKARARLVARQDLVVCGLPLLPLIMEVYKIEASVEAFCHDGTPCPSGTHIAGITGPASGLLTAERVLLNFLQRLSGVATNTAAFVRNLRGSSTKLLDTRKTTPGLRVLEKYATACGGGYNHRIGLFDRVMLKDNHLAAARSDKGRALAELVRQTRLRAGDLLVELEVDHPDQISPALSAGVDIVLLDNFSPAEAAEAVRQIKQRAVTEISGGVTLASLPGLAAAGADFISTGATVHQAHWCDIGMDWQQTQA